MTTRRALISLRVLALSMVYFAIVFGLYGLGFWIPTIIKKSLSIQDNFVVTLLVAAPYAVGTIAIIFWGRLVDRRGRQALLTAIPMFVGGLALALTAFGTSMPWLGYAGLSVCAIGIMASFPGFWTLPSVFMSGAAGAVGIAVINAIGNLSGFAGPYWVGWMTDLFGDAKWGLNLHRRRHDLGGDGRAVPRERTTADSPGCRISGDLRRDTTLGGHGPHRGCGPCLTRLTIEGKPMPPLRSRTTTFGRNMAGARVVARHRHDRQRLW